MTGPERGAARPLPYCGDDPSRLERLGQAYSTDRAGDEASGRIDYAYNAAGFRGPEFDGAAPHRIFAFGEETAFGLGVPFAQCWPTRFVARWSERRGVGPADVCYQNFAEPGSSNTAIARAVISQCEAVRPELVLVHFGDLRRAEGQLGGRPFRVGPWLSGKVAARAVRRAPRRDGERARQREQLARGRSYLRFATDDQLLTDTLRSVLLVQYYCKAQGIRAVAATSLLDLLRSPDQRADPVHAPLLAQLDAAFLCGDGDILACGDDLAVDGVHPGPARHDGLARRMLDFLDAGPPAPRADSRPVVADAVRSFYDTLPFNHWGSVQAAADAIRANPIRDDYPDLHDLLTRGGVRSVAEFGCGAGWLCCALARHYGVTVTAVDFSASALRRAADLTAAVGVADRVTFVRRDLFDDHGEARFDLVVSLGVLHHTGAARRAFGHVQQAARDGGHVYIGLYHHYGRRVFLDRFRRLVDEQGEAAAFARFCALAAGRGSDEEHLRSWFRDQVLHPHETQHTLREVCGWLDEHGLRLCSTSINRFGPIDDRDALFALEPGYADRSRQANLVEGRYFPGFFTFLARRPEA